MNNVSLIGRLVRDPEVRYTTGSDPKAVATLTVAIDRPSSGEEKKADFPRVIAWGRLAENCEKYLHKGSQVGITGSIQTGSYEKDGRTVYTTDVLARNVEFLGGKAETQRGETQSSVPEDIPSGFEQMSYDDDMPF